jgi:hypothetical protein
MLALLLLVTLYIYLGVTKVLQKCYKSAASLKNSLFMPFWSLCECHSGSASIEVFASLAMNCGILPY